MERTTEKSVVQRRRESSVDVEQCRAREWKRPEKGEGPGKNQKNRGIAEENDMACMSKQRVSGRRKGVNPK